MDWFERGLSLVLLLIAVTGGYHQWCYGQNRIRILFINNAPEDVYIAIGNVPLKPLKKYLVALGTKKYRFPLEFTAEKPLYVTISSMSNEINYMLRLNGDLDKSSTRSCHAYGEILLLRDDLTMQTLGASNIDTGLILEYTSDFELILRRMAERERPHVDAKKALYNRQCHKWRGGCPA